MLLRKNEFYSQKLEAELKISFVMFRIFSISSINTITNWVSIFFTEIPYRTHILANLDPAMLWWIKPFFARPRHDITGDNINSVLMKGDIWSLTKQIHDILYCSRSLTYRHITRPVGVDTLSLPSQHRASIHKADRRLTARCREASKPRDSGLYFSNRSEIWQATQQRSEIWQASRQRCCREACQISERSNN